MLLLKFVNLLMRVGRRIRRLEDFGPFSAEEVIIFWRNVYRVLRRTFYYSGRACRDEFWWWMRLLFRALLVSSVAFVVEHTLLVRSLPNLGTLLGTVIMAGLLVAVLGFFPTMSLAVRRLHDTGRSGEAMLVWFVAPLFTWIVSFGIGFVSIGIALAGLDPSVVVIAFYASLGVAVAPCRWCYRLGLRLSGWRLVCDGLFTNPGSFAVPIL